MEVLHAAASHPPAPAATHPKESKIPPTTPQPLERMASSWATGGRGFSPWPSPRQPWGTGAIACPADVCQLPGLARARGWATVPSMRHHIDAHLAGTVAGDVPSTWLETHNRTRCLVCGLSVSVAHGVHPTCRPQARLTAVDAAHTLTDTFDQNLHPPPHGTTERVGHCACQGGGLTARPVRPCCHEAFAHPRLPPSMP